MYNIPFDIVFVCGRAFVCVGACVCVYVQDVEANTVRLKEHGQDVLVLERSLGNSRSSIHGASSSQYK